MKTLNELLALNLQFFAEGETEAVNSPDGALNTGEAGASEQPNKDHMIPKSRFDEVNSKFKEVQGQLQALLDAKAQADKEAQEKQGKFQELYEATNKEYSEIQSKYTNVESRAQQLEGVISGLLDSKLASIPEELHDIIPEHLTPEAKLDWVNKAEAKGIFGKKEQSPIGETTSPSHAQATDLNALSPMALLRAGYGSK